MRVVKSEGLLPSVDRPASGYQPAGLELLDASGSLDPWQPGDYRNLHGGSGLELKSMSDPELPGVITPEEAITWLLRWAGGSKATQAKGHRPKAS